ncbi:MAG TPA: carboxypeptidase regulatory-like domain-containing protein, partial [Pyrinomonadaceae bacterium]|nr:carboxypeptidase regulatory-like domain-containing protein [Pyrinomonadaceae bacterium]
AIAIDPFGNVYVTGWTLSPEFPLKNQYQTFAGRGYDVFVTKLDTNSAGAGALLYSTCLGGTNSDWSTGIAADASGNVYVVADTESWDFPTKHPVQEFHGEFDLAVFKLDPNLAGADSLVYSTYLGGSYWDFSTAIAIDPFGNAYVTGYTFSDDFPKRHKYQARQFGVQPWGFPTADAFVAKLSATYRISGRVTSDGTIGIRGVTVTLGGSKNATVVTGGGGKYSFGGLLAGEDYTITPARGDLRFSPSRLSFDALAADYAGMDFTARDKAAIGGRVTVDTAAGAGLGGVTMTLTGGTNFTPRTATTDSYGTYSFVNLPAAGSYKLTPSKTNYNFGPEHQAVVDLTGPRPDTDFIATRKTYAVGGVIQIDGAGMSGVTVRLTRKTPAGFVPETTTTDNGVYSFPNVPAGLTYTVTPALPGFRFEPVSRSVVNLSGNQTAVNFSVKFYSIKGRVTRAGTATGIGGVTITLTSTTFPGFQARTTATDSNGYYTVPYLLAGNSYTLKPEKTGFTFSPGMRSVTNLSGNLPARPYTGFTATGP